MKVKTFSCKDHAQKGQRALSFVVCACHVRCRDTGWIIYARNAIINEITHGPRLYTSYKAETQQESVGRVCTQAIRHKHHKRVHGPRLYTGYKSFKLVSHPQFHQKMIESVYQQRK